MESIDVRILECDDTLCLLEHGEVDLDKVISDYKYMLQKIYDQNVKIKDFRSYIEWLGK